MNIDDTALHEILLVEDEPADAHLFKAALREGGIHARLHHAADGVAAMSFLNSDDHDGQHPRPDLILLDLNMPRMNGREFLAAIKSEKKLLGIPVVVLTSSDAERDVLSAYALGASGYITKPVDMDRFAAVVHGLDAYWFGMVRLPGRT